MGWFGPPNVEKMTIRRDVQGLTRALRYRKSSAIRREAARALGRLGDPVAVGGMVEQLLLESNATTRQELIDALRQIGGDQAIHGLTQALVATDDDDVREALAKALEASGWQPTPDAEGAAYWIGQGEPERCVAIGPAAVEPLLRALRPDRLRLMICLGRLEDVRAAEPIVQYLLSARLRKEVLVASRALEWIGPPALPTLREAEAQAEGEAQLHLQALLDRIEDNIASGRSVLPDDADEAFHQLARRGRQAISAFLKDLDFLHVDALAEGRCLRQDIEAAILIEDKVMLQTSVVALEALL